MHGEIGQLYGKGTVFDCLVSMNVWKRNSCFTVFSDNRTLFRNSKNMNSMSIFSTPFIGDFAFIKISLGIKVLYEVIYIIMGMRSLNNCDACNKKLFLLKQGVDNLRYLSDFYTTNFIYQLYQNNFQLFTKSVTSIAVHLIGNRLNALWKCLWHFFSRELI